MKRPIIAAVDDLFFVAKIRGAAQFAGIEVSFSRSVQATVAAAKEREGALVIVDLHAQQFDPLALARAVKADDQLRSVKLLGFFSHVQTALMHQATAAGYDYVLPRSAFAARLPEILAGKISKDKEETRND